MSTEQIHTCLMCDICDWCSCETEDHESMATSHVQSLRHLFAINDQNLVSAENQDALYSLIPDADTHRRELSAQRWRAAGLSEEDAATAAALENNNE